MSTVESLRRNAPVRPMASGRVFNFSAGPAALPLDVLQQL